MTDATPPIATGADTSNYERYLLANRAFAAPAVTAAIASLSSGTRGGRILDAGTGAGGALGPLAELGRVTAVDIDPRAISLATEHVAELDISDRVEVWAGDVRQRVRDEEASGAGYDLIWASDVVWPATFTDPAAVVDGFAAALASAGTLALFTTNYHQSMFLPGHSRLERLVRAASEATWGLPEDGRTHHERLGVWLRRAGLGRIRLQVYPIVASSVLEHAPAADYLARIVWPEMLHAVRSNGRAIGMSTGDVLAAEQLLDPAGARWIGADRDAFVMQPTLLWTAQRAG